MTFERALAELRQGKKVRRKIWSGSDYIYVKQSENALPVHWCIFDQKDNPLSTLNPSSIFADDWEIVDAANDRKTRIKEIEKELLHMNGEWCGYHMAMISCENLANAKKKQIEAFEKELDKLKRGE